MHPRFSLFHHQHPQLGPADSTGELGLINMHSAAAGACSIHPAEVTVLISWDLDSGNITGPTCSSVKASAVDQAAA
jgi:hypothetical protein